MFQRFWVELDERSDGWENAKYKYEIWWILFVCHSHNFAAAAGSYREREKERGRMKTEYVITLSEETGERERGGGAF